MTHKVGKHNNIPPAEYCYREQFGDFITWDQVENYHTVDEVTQFEQWMNGQTVSEIDGKTAIYADDYERWLRGLPVID